MGLLSRLLIVVGVVKKNNKYSIVFCKINKKPMMTTLKKRGV